MTELMSPAQVELEMNRLYSELEPAVTELGIAGEAAAKTDIDADRALDRALLVSEGTVVERQARAREAAYEARLAAAVAKANERTAKANLGRIETQLDVLRSMSASFRKV